MNRLIPFLLGAGFLLIFTDSKGHSHNPLNGKFKKVSPEVAHLNDLLRDNTFGSIPMADTTNPGNKNRGTAQDYNSTRSNKANCVIIINVGDSKPTNNKDSSSNNHPSAISTAQDFNTTRSNRQNSAIVINVGNNNPNSNDSTPQKNYAQDFNTVRSNRQNSNYNQKIIINVEDNRPANKDQEKLKTGKNDGVEPIDDWDSPVLIVVNTNNSSSISRRVSVKTFDTTFGNTSNLRVLKNPPNESYNPWEMDDSNEGTVLNPLFDSDVKSGDNPMYEGTNKNGIRERHYQIGGDVILVIREMDPNKNANQKKDNPLYEGSNTTHENPLYDGNKMTTHGGGNSTNNPGKQPTRQEAQDYNSSRSNKCSGHLLAGVSNGGGDHTGSGWNIELGNRFSIVNHFFIDVSASYTSLNFKYKGSSFLSEEYVQNMQRSIQNNRWNLMTFSVGPVVQLGSGKFNADIYAKPGMTFIQSPDQFIGVQDSRGHVTYETGAAKFSGSATAFSVQAGININYAVSKRVDIFLNPNFFTAVGKNISYQEKDASKALLDDKSFDYKTFMTLPYETKQEQLRTLGVSAGFRIYFCR